MFIGVICWFTLRAIETMNLPFIYTPDLIVLNTRSTSDWLIHSLSISIISMSEYHLLQNNLNWTIRLSLSIVLYFHTEAIDSTVPVDSSSEQCFLWSIVSNSP